MRGLIRTAGDQGQRVLTTAIQLLELAVLPPVFLLPPCRPGLAPSMAACFYWARVRSNLDSRAAWAGWTRPRRGGGFEGEAGYRQCSGSNMVGAEHQKQNDRQRNTQHYEYD